MNLNLSSKNALVCGASKGIGESCAIRLASLGANITLVSRSPDKMSDVIAQMKSDDGQDHDFLIADFQNTSDLNKKIKTLVAHKVYHILINNTGGPATGAILDATSDQFIKAFNNHLICNHLLTQLLVPGMKKEGFGRIINIISTSVKTPIPNLGVSNTIRGAVASWAKTMAGELGPFGITVNNILPGFTDTDRLKELLNGKAKALGVSYESVLDEIKSSTPVRRIGTPMEIGAAVAFLSSVEASFITGINLPVDGGRTPCL